MGQEAAIAELPSVQLRAAHAGPAGSSPISTIARVWMARFIPVSTLQGRGRFRLGQCVGSQAELVAREKASGTPSSPALKSRSRTSRMERVSRNRRTRSGSYLPELRCSSSGMSRMVTREPRSSSTRSLCKSFMVRVIVSREAPMQSPTSTWVIGTQKRRPRAVCCPVWLHSKKSRANLD